MDDSKSARLFLARVLENYDIDVDSADSAEAAIEYLTTNRPDVIFMDHMMPGMDGLQAVQAIKNDARTATIPIMMYTSQEGELYLGQARALGALGVLPKQIKPADVSKVLYQLHLVPDRRSGEQSSFTALNVQVDGIASPAVTAGKALTETKLRDHFAELRRALIASSDTQTDRITGEVRALLLEALPPPRPGASLPTARIPLPWIVACAALAIALVSSALWWRSVRLLEGVRLEVSELRALQPAATRTVAAAAALPAQPTPRPSAGSPEVKPVIMPVPYGAEALGGARLEAIRQLLYRLARQKARGVVDIKTFAGRFCLLGSAPEGYSLAPEETPLSRCDLVGNPSEETLSSTPRIPLGLANLIAEIRSITRGTLDVQVSAGDPASLIVPYPTAAGELTAGEWNHAALANNRVEIRLR